MVSSAYIKSPTAASFAGFSAGSFRDMTRVAFLNADMWTELFLDNRGPLQQEIEGIIGQLHAFSEALKTGDAALLHALLQDGREKKIQADALLQSDTTC